MLLNDVFPVIASWLTTKRNYSLKSFGTKTHIHLKSIVIIFLITDVPMYHLINKFT